MDANIEMRKKVYISLPITGHDLDNVENRSVLASITLEKFGFEPVSPLDVCDDIDATYEDLIGHDITALLKCDAVVFLEGWKDSKGCNLEHEAARIYGMRMLFSVEDIKSYSQEHMF